MHRRYISFPEICNVKFAVKVEEITLDYEIGKERIHSSEVLYSQMLDFLLFFFPGYQTDIARGLQLR